MSLHMHRLHFTVSITVERWDVRKMCTWRKRKTGPRSGECKVKEARRVSRERWTELRGQAHSRPVIVSQSMNSLPVFEYFASDRVDVPKGGLATCTQNLPGATEKKTEMVKTLRQSNSIQPQQRN